MTPNDKQIDLLMRRYAPNSVQAATGDHLDADEVNAFAEGSLPPAARARYVSHLADCDQCRQIVSQVALSGGAAARVEPVVEKAPTNFWESLTGWFSVPALRYGALAAMLLLIAGVAFVALRSSKRPADIVAVNEPVNQQPTIVTKEPDTTGTPNAASANSATPVPEARPTAAAESSKAGETTITPTTRAAKDSPVPVEPEKKADQPPPVAAKAPGYSPPPTGETQVATNQQSNAGGAVLRKVEPTDQLAQQQERDAAKESGRTDESRRLAMNQSAPRQRSTDKKETGGPSRNFENQQSNQTLNQTRNEAPKTTGADDRAATEEAPATRSVGGRTFHRQGGAWVDQKYKSGISLKRVSRGSDEFNALDSGLRSIAQQLGGEVIVVWKGQAYLIK